MERGKINFRERSRQIRDYSGLRYKNITPTDIDGFLEIQDKVFIFLEFKTGKTQLTFGQELALERLCDNTNRPTILIIAKHNHSIDEDIDAAKCQVVKYRYARKWYNANPGKTVKFLIDRFLIKNKLSIYLEKDFQ